MLIDITDRNISRLMKWTLLVRKHPELLEKIYASSYQEINHRTEKGLTALILAVLFAGSFSHEKVLEFLLSRGATFDRKHVKINILNLIITAIINVKRGYSSYDALKILLRSRIENPCLSSRPGELTSIGAAAVADDPISIQILLQHGVSINLQSGIGTTAVSVAADRNSLEAMKILLSHRPNIEIKDGNGCTSLNIAAYKGRVEAARMLILAGADLEAKMNDGRSPLIHAIQQNHLEMVKLLDVTKTMDIKSPPIKAFLQQIQDNQRTLSTPLLHRCVTELCLSFD